MKGLGNVKRHVWLSLLMMTISAAVRADTYYVSTSGSDENPGSEALAANGEAAAEVTGSSEN